MGCFSSCVPSVTKRSAKSSLARSSSRKSSIVKQFSRKGSLAKSFTRKGSLDESFTRKSAPVKSLSREYSLAKSSSVNGSLARSSSTSSLDPSAIIIIPPLGLDNQSSFFPSSNRDSNTKKLLLGGLDVLKAVRPGSDLTSFQVPSQMSLPKSQLQLMGEQIYCCSQNLLDQCADGATPVDRFLAVVRWHISLIRPVLAKVPYNPILGETHHVTAGDLNLLLEQVSHHPPISALYATNSAKQLEVLQWSQPLPRLSSLSLSSGSVDVSIGGKRILTLAELGESYEMNTPKLSMRFFPKADTEWKGDTFVRCAKTGLEAKVTFKARSYFSWGGGASNCVSGTIWKTEPQGKNTLHSLTGRWDESITVEDTQTEKKTQLYDGKTALTDLKGPEIKGETLPTTESLAVWSRVTEALWKEEWDIARITKTGIEQEQRELRKERSKAGETWNPKFFNQTSDGDWEWASKGRPVPHAAVAT